MSTGEFTCRATDTALQLSYAPTQLCKRLDIKRIVKGGQQTVLVKADDPSVSSIARLLARGGCQFTNRNTSM
eukprot:m.426910 g.426910  ORF g.426910 m.426910 type:complete len:72 (+) comp21360_c0_seq1:1527-1742(+)